MNGCSACSLVKNCGMDKNFPCPFMGDREIKPSDIKRIEHKEVIVAEQKIFGENLFARMCSYCGDMFNKGLLDERDHEVYCNHECAAHDMSPEDLSDGIKSGALFYTEWEESDCDDRYEGVDEEPKKLEEEPDDEIGEEEQAELDSAAEDKYFNRD